MSFYFAYYSRKFKKSFSNAIFSLDKKDGIYLTKDFIHFSEVSPLVGFSKETTDQMMRDLRKKKIPQTPSFNFALSMLDFSLESFSPIKCNALLSIETPDNMESDLLFFYKKGFRTFKIKISPKTFLKTSETLCAFRNTFKDIQFRLDANQSFDFEYFLNLKPKLEDLPIEYIEDPLHPSLSHKLTELASKIKIPFAADMDYHLESFSSQKFDHSYDYLVLKPATLGHVDSLFKIKDKYPQKKIIISSLLETEIGIRNLLKLSSKLSPQLIHGLSTTSFFEENFWDVSPLFPVIPSIGQKEKTFLDSLSWEKFNE